MCDLAERLVVQGGTKLPILQNGSRKNAYCKNIYRKNIYCKNVP